MDGGNGKSRMETYSWTGGEMDVTYAYGRADGRGTPRILLMDDWQRDDSLRGRHRMQEDRQTGVCCNERSLGSVGVRG